MNVYPRPIKDNEFTLAAAEPFSQARLGEGTSGDLVIDDFQKRQPTNG